MSWVPVAVTIALSLISVVIAYTGMQRTWKNNLEKEKSSLKHTANTQGENSGQMRTDMGYLRKGVDDIMAELRDQRKMNVEILTRLTAVEESTRQAHSRISTMEGRTAGGNSL